MEKHNTHPSEPLLEPEAGTRNIKSSSIEQFWRSIIVLLSCASFILAAILTRTFLGSTKSMSRPYSPANVALSYKTQPMFPSEDNVFYGPPSDLQDSAWADLLTPVNIRVTKKEMITGKETLENAVQLADGDYVVVLAVYHELHCLNVMRRYLYSDRYEPNRTESETGAVVQHLTHCINILRHFAMCHADVSMYSVEWLSHPVGNINKQLKSNAEAVCVDWDEFDQWGRKRALVGERFVRKPHNRVQPEGSDDNDAR